MPITKRAAIADVAAVVATALRHAGFDTVLTGGACAAIYSAGAYVSHDLDFIIRQVRGIQERGFETATRRVATD